MSSIAIIQKSKLTPLNLTNETVFQIMREAPIKVPSSKKMYPTAKYATEEVRSAAEINTKIIKKIKQLQRVNSQQKRPRVRIELCKTEASNNNYINKYNLRTQISKNSVEFKSSQDRSDLFNSQKQKPKEKHNKSDSPQKSEAQTYYEKISRVKNMKLRLYMRSKFAIDAKTIQTARNNQKSSENQNQKNSGQSLHLNFPRRILLCRHSKSQYQQKLKNKSTANEQIQNIEEADKEQLQASGEHLNQENNIQSKDLKNLSGAELKLARIMKKTERFQKTQLLEKKLGFTREFEDHPADVRFQRMINQLDLILYSFSATYAIKRPLPAYNKNCEKFKYFVGAGNNKNLIVSLMKKRWWWSQTNSMTEAHFVWTQIKQQKVLQHCSKTQNQKHISDSSVKADIKLQQHSSSIKKLKSKQLNIKNKLFHSNLSIKFDEQTYQRLQATKQLKSIQILKKIHNHYNGNSMLGNKKALFHFLSYYCEYKNINRYDYIPLTFHITDENSQEMHELKHAFSQTHANSYWILKPGQNSNRGNGISVTKSIQKIQQKVRNLEGGTLIVQKYIDNLFLYKHRKFDIRTYMIAVTIAGSTKFYWHAQGYLRTSSFVYSMKDHDNIFVHLTNDAIQSTNQNYGKHEQGNKLSYQQFQRYLDKNYHNKGYSIKQTHEQMRDIAKLAIRATYPEINSSKLEYSFQVFGLDFIIDSNFKPWLIEVNTNPCLQLSSSTLQRLIPQMIQNTLRLALDPVYQPCVEFPRSMSSSVPDNIFTSNRFSIIFDDLYDREPQWEKTLADKIKEITKQQEDQQEQFEGDGEIIDNV